VRAVVGITNHDDAQKDSRVFPFLRRRAEDCPPYQNLFFVFFTFYGVKFPLRVNNSVSALQLKLPSRASAVLPAVQFFHRQPELLFADSRIGP